jgi:hypothetical protein
MNKLRKLITVFFRATALIVLVSGAIPTAVQGRGNAIEISPLYVNNVEANSIQARDVPNIATEPFQIQLAVDLTEGVATANKTFTAIPAGKRFVIEYVSMRGYVQTEQKLQVWLKKGSYDYALVAHSQVSYPNGKEYFAASETVKIYFNAGESLTAFASRWNNTGNSQLIFTLSGYLVDIQ